MLFSMPPGAGAGGGFQKTCRRAWAADSNQYGLLSPGLPASPKPGLNRARLCDIVFFDEKHVFVVQFAVMLCELIKVAASNSVITIPSESVSCIGRPWL